MSNDVIRSIYKHQKLDLLIGFVSGISVCIIYRLLYKEEERTVKKEDYKEERTVKKEED